MVFPTLLYCPHIGIRYSSHEVSEVLVLAPLISPCIIHILLHYKALFTLGLKFDCWPLALSRRLIIHLAYSLRGAFFLLYLSLYLYSLIAHTPSGRLSWVCCPFCTYYLAWFHDFHVGYDSWGVIFSSPLGICRSVFSLLKFYLHSSPVWSYLPRWCFFLWGGSYWFFLYPYHLFLVSCSFLEWWILLLLSLYCFMRAIALHYYQYISTKFKFYMRFTDVETIDIVLGEEVRLGKQMSAHFLTPLGVHT